MATLLPSKRRITRPARLTFAVVCKQIVRGSCGSLTPHSAIHQTCPSVGRLSGWRCIVVRIRCYVRHPVWQFSDSKNPDTWCQARKTLSRATWWIYWNDLNIIVDLSRKFHNDTYNRLSVLLLGCCNKHHMYVFTTTISLVKYRCIYHNERKGKSADQCMR